MTGLLPPSSSVTGVLYFAAAAAIIRPTRVEPVKKMCAHWSSRSAFASSIAPVMTRYAAGSKYFGTSLAMRAEVAGDDSEGLITVGHPAAMAPMSGLNDKMTGKFHGLRKRACQRERPARLEQVHPRDEQHDALGNVVDGGVPRALPRLHLRLLRRGPLLEVLDGVQAVRDDGRDLERGRLLALLAEVGQQSLLEGRDVVLHHACELQQLLAAVAQGPGRARPEGLFDLVISLTAASVAMRRVGVLALYLVDLLERGIWESV